MKQEFVKDWMSSNVITTSVGAPLAVARNLMKKNNIRRLPVLDKGQLVGIVTKSDLEKTEPASMSSLTIWDIHDILSHLYVRGVMTTNPIVVSPDDTIGQAATLMLSNKISGLPVVDQNQQLVGMITESDIFRLVIAAP